MAAFVVSNAATQNVSCSAGVCTATSHFAVLNKSDLAGMLASGDVTLQAGSSPQDIDFKVSFSGAGTNRLTLDAYRSIVFEKAVEVTGSGAMTLTTNDGGTGGTLSFTAAARIHFWDLGSSLIINGASYTLVGDIATLASDITANASGDYALADNYDATPDGIYAHSPVPTTFSGAFEGLGNTISKLRIQDTTESENVGLFASLAAAGTIENVSLASIFVGGGSYKSIGGLVAVNAGRLFGDVAAGVVQGGSSQPTAGLLVGANSGTIVNCHSAGEVKAKANTYLAFLGGLVGFSTSVIDHSFSSANVSGRAENDGNDSGGLVGAAPSGTITNSYATGTAAGNYGGGLVGAQESHLQSDIHTLTIRNSYASGAASGFAGAGGLVAWVQNGLIAGSHATGSVSGGLGGGLVGNFAGGTISLSWASGTVTGGAGGLVGTNGAAINNSYATGAVHNGHYVGGFVGNSSGTSTIVDAYEIGAVSGGTYTGGFAGFNHGGYQAKGCTDCYWNTTTSGTLTGFGRGFGDGIVGLTSAQLQSGLPAGFDPSIWAQDPSINGGFPYLISNPPA